MASSKEWHLPVQEETNWLQLLLFKNKAGNIAKIAKRMHETNLAPFYPTPAKLSSKRPITNCLAGICTKRNTAWF